MQLFFAFLKRKIPYDKRDLVCGTDINDPVASAKQIDEMLAVSFLDEAAKAEFSEDKKSVTLSFGGVYPFRNIYFRTNGISLFTVYYFDGSKFQQR